MVVPVHHAVAIAAAMSVIVAAAATVAVAVAVATKLIIVRELREWMVVRLVCFHMGQVYEGIQQPSDLLDEVVSALPSVDVERPQRVDPRGTA